MTCSRIAIVTLVALATQATTDADAQAPIRLCDRLAASTGQLYFDIAKQLDARILRADERETVVDTPSNGVLWIFVAKPAAVLCRRDDRPDAVESTCDGPDDVCTPLIRRLTDDPRASP